MTAVASASFADQRLGGGYGVVRHQKRSAELSAKPLCLSKTKARWQDARSGGQPPQRSGTEKWKWYATTDGGDKTVKMAKADPGGGRSSRHKGNGQAEGGPQEINQKIYQTWRHNKDDKSNENNS